VPNQKPIEHDGRSLTLTEWAREAELPVSTLRARLALGWDLARAMATPADRRFARGGRKRKNAPRPCPPLKEHSSGQAYCRWNEHGQDRWRYFGLWGSAEAAAAYRRFQVEWAAGSVRGPQHSDNLVLVADVGLRWLAHCERTFVKRGKITSEVYCHRSAWAVLGELYGDTPAAEFDARMLRAVRQAMIDRGWVRKTTNEQVARIVRAFAWAATERLVPREVYEVLALVEPIAKGRPYPTPDPDAKEPVPAAHVEAVMPHLHPKAKRRAVYEAMIRVQMLTGMRPGELCSVRPEQIDRRREPWRMEVVEFNKMLHKNLKKVIFFGPQARSVLAPLLATAEPGQPLFRLPPWRKKALWSPISTQRYRNRIRLACLAAGVPVWTPHQLRHNRATEVMERYEDDRAAAAVIGDSPEVTRQVYAARPGEAVAKRIAEATG
jgi:integrase